MGHTKSDVKIPGPEVAYTDLIDLVQADEEETYDAFPLRPSSANKCSKAMAMELANWYGKANFPIPKPEPTLKRLFDLGYAIERQEIRLLDKLGKLNPDFRTRFKQQFLPVMALPNGQIVGGSSDVWIVNRMGNQAAIGDVKSKKDSFSTAFKTSWDEALDKFDNMETLTKVGDSGWYAADLPAFLKELNDHFFESNFRQLNIYCCTDFAKIHGVDHGFILRQNKNDSRHVEIRFSPHEGLAQEFKDKCLKVYQTVESTPADEIAKLPCDFVPGSAAYAFCDCHKMSGQDPKEALDAYFKTFPKKKWPTDLGKIKSSQPIKKLFAEFEEKTKIASELTYLEQQIAKELADQKISKVRLPNGHVYEVKALKTGGVANGPRVVLRRSKA